MFAYSNMINVKVDEVSDVVEVFDEEFNPKNTLNELKNIYKNVIILLIILVKLCSRRVN